MDDLFLNIYVLVRSDFYFIKNTRFSFLSLSDTFYKAYTMGHSMFARKVILDFLEKLFKALKRRDITELFPVLFANLHSFCDV